MKHENRSKLIRLGSIRRDTKAIVSAGQQEEFLPILSYS